MSGVKGLNTTDSANRVRFANLSQRLSRVNVDVVHKIRAQGSLDLHHSATPTTGALGCHFQDELELCKTLDTASHFKRFYYAIWPLVQSLPELLHHQGEVVTMIETYISKGQPATLSSFLQLISVLGRDLEDDLYPHFHRLFGLLVKQVDTVAYSGNSKSGGSNAPNPELTGKLFETLSYLLKYQLHRLSEESSSMRKYYGPLLGHTASFVREYSAKAFSLLMRKLKPKTFKTQCKQLLRAVASNCRSNSANVNGDIGLLMISEFEGSIENQCGMKPSKRIQDLLDGLSLLFFSTCKGVKGCLHSKGGDKLSVVMDLLLPISTSTLEAVSNAEVKNSKNVPTNGKGKKTVEDVPINDVSILSEVSVDDAWVTYALAQVLTDCLIKLFRHLHPSNMAEIWLRLLSLSDAVQRACVTLNSITDISDGLRMSLECSAMFVVEALLFGLCHSKGRGLSNSEVRSSVEDKVINVCLSLCEVGLCGDTRTNKSNNTESWRSSRLIERQRLLLCRLWLHFPRNLTLLNRVDRVLTAAIPCLLPTPAAPLLASQLLPALPVDISRKYLVRPLLSAILAMVQSPSLKVAATAISSSDTSTTISTSSRDPTPWLGVLLEILMKLCDVRSSDVCLEPELNSAPTKEHYKKKSNGLRRLKGPDVGTEEWGNLSDDMGNGSDDSEEEYSSSDESVEALKEGEELPGGASVGTGKVFSVTGGSQLTTLLSSCSAELAVIAGACLDVLLNSSGKAVRTNEKLVGAKSAQIDGSVGSDAIVTNVTSGDDSVSLIMACTCVRWLVVAFPDPLLDSSDSPTVISTSKIKKSIKKCTSNNDKFSAVLSSITSTVCAANEDTYAPTDYQCLAHHTQLLVSVLNQPKLKSLLTESQGSDVKVRNAKDPESFCFSFKKCEEVLPSLVQKYVRITIRNPHSLASIWALLGLLQHLTEKREEERDRDEMQMDALDEERESVLTCLLSSQDLDSLLTSIGTALQTRSHWLRVCLLKLLSYLPRPKLSAVQGERRDGDEVRSVDIALLCLETACTPAELRHEREFARRAGKLEVHVRSGRLPAPYVRMICSMCLGLLNVKFKPFWEPSILLLIAAAASKAGEAELWPLLLQFIQTASKKSETATSGKVLRIQSDAEKSNAEDLGSDSVPAEDILSATLTASSDVTALSSRAVDCGEECITAQLAGCKMFYFRVDPTPYGRVEPDSRTDAETVFSNAWDVLKRCPNITLARSRTVVPMFLRFLRWQYYVAFKEDPELPFLISIGFLSTPDSEEIVLRNENQNSDSDACRTETSILHPSVLKKRLEMFLKVFSAVVSPKQLYLHQELFNYYNSILSRSETNIVRLAFDCIVGYKPEYLMPVRENIKRMLDDKLIRDELVVFDPSVGGVGGGGFAGVVSGSSAVIDEGQLGIIDPTHRRDLVPLLVRVLYGRFVSKARGSKQARELNLARRSAILSFLSRLPPSETNHLTHLMLRGVVPSVALFSAAATMAESSTVREGGQIHASLSDHSAKWYDIVDNIASSMTVHEVTNVQWERQIGFLHLLEQTVRLVGFGVTDHVGVLLKVVLAMLSGAQSGVWSSKGTDVRVSDVRSGDSAGVGVLDENEDEEDDDVDVEGDEKEQRKEGTEGREDGVEERTASYHRDINQASKVRSLSLLRLSEMVHQYHGRFEFTNIRIELLIPLGGLITALPGAITGSSKPPGLLRLLNALVRYDETVGVVVPALPVFVEEQDQSVPLIKIDMKKKMKIEGSVKGSRTDIKNQEIVPTVVPVVVQNTESTDLIVQTLIRCVASRAEFEVSRMVMDILSTLLEREEGRAILPHAHLIIRCFSKRFVGPDFDDSPGVVAQLKLSEMRIAPTGSVKQELKLLCRIAEIIFSRNDVTIDSTSVCNLATLLLGMLRTYTTSRKVRVEEDWVLNILRIYRSLLWRMEDVTPHVAFIGRLFGPAGHSLSLFNLATVRAELTVVYTAMASHASSRIAPSLPLNALVIIALTAMDRKLIDSRDFGECMPVFQALGGEIKALTPLITTPVDTSITATASKKKRSRVEISEPNVSKTQKISLTGKTTDLQVEVEIVLDINTLSWSALLGPEGCSAPRVASLCMVAVHECLRCMYDSELVIRSGALTALKRLCSEAGVWCGVRHSVSTGDEDSEDHQSSDSLPLTSASDVSAGWLEVLTSVVVPGVRRGLKQSTDTVKKGFVSLLSHIVQQLGRPTEDVLSTLTLTDSPSSSLRPSLSSSLSCTPSHSLVTLPIWSQLCEMFHSDLHSLLHEDPEQNFFENINHIQLHRRVRAFARMRNILRAAAIAANSTAFLTPALLISVVTNSGISNPEFAMENGLSKVEESDPSILPPPLSLEGADLTFTGPILTIGIASLTHVLLPVALHPLVSEEFKKKDHLTLLQESAAFVGSIGLHLPWTQYFALIKTILKQLDRQKEEKEKVLLSALCSILDSFHFEFEGDEEAEGMDVPALSLSRKVMKPKNKKLTVEEKVEGRMILEEEDGEKGSLSVKKMMVDKEGNDVMEEEGFEEEEEVQEVVKKVTDDEDNAANADDDTQENENGVDNVNELKSTTPVNKSHTIARAVVNSIMPWVKVFLLKEEKDHKGNKSKTVRPMVALALTKLISRLHAPVVSEEKKSTLFASLVIRVVDTLRSRDSSARDAARDSLSKMVITMGLGSLNTVIYELQHSLTEGYQRHVCNYTVRHLLTAVLDGYSPPPAPSFSVIDQEGVEATFKDKESITSPIFDQCIPMVIKSVLDDLNGDSQEDREADAAKAAIREAKGNKANDTLEVCARCLLFRPTYALKHLEDPSAVSSIHALVTPLLTALRNSDSSSHAIAATDSMGGKGALIGRIGEALQRVALGLSRNPSVTAPELLLYLHATLQPFVVAVVREKENQKRVKGMLDRPRIASASSTDQQEDEEEEEDEDEELPSYLREQSSDEEDAALYSKKKLNAKGKKSKDRKDDVNGFRANTWLPSESRSVNDQRAAVTQRDNDRATRDAVLDGSRAPKLTGRNRYMKGKSGGASANESTGPDPAAIAAVRFCLSLFSASLKRNKMDPTDRVVLSMSAPFVPLLGQCLRLSGAVDVVTLATRCLCTLLTWGIHVEASFVQAVGGRLLRLMLRSGALRSTDSELVQACIRGLTALFSLHNNRLAERADNRAFNKEKRVMMEINELLPDDIDMATDSIVPSSSSSSAGGGGGDVSVRKAVLPLTVVNIRSLLGLLTASIMEVASNFQNVAFQLIRSIVDAKVIVPEVYDLIDKLAEQIPLSQRKGARESAASVVITFITTYPLGDKRIATHMKQMITNCSYAYEEGRLSSFEALTTLVRLLPLPILEDNAQTIFLPMTLRLVNDSAPQCREAAADVIAALARRVSPEIVNTFIRYSVKWLSSSHSSMSSGSTSGEGIANSAQARALVRTGSQVAGLMVSTRPDLFKKLGFVLQTVASVRAMLVALLKVMNSSGTGTGGGGGEDKERKRGSLERRETSKYEEGQGDGGGAESWAVSYHLLVLVEKLYTHLPGATDHAVCHPQAAADSLDAAIESKNTEEEEDDGEGGVDGDGADEGQSIAVKEKGGMVLFMEAVQEAMLFPHAWVRSASCRVLSLYLGRRDVNGPRLRTFPHGLEVLTMPNGLYQLARRLCIVLNQPKLNPVLLQNAVTATVFTIRAMSRNPDLSIVPTVKEREAKSVEEIDEEDDTGESEDDKEESEDEDESEEEEEEEEEEKDQVTILDSDVDEDDIGQTVASGTQRTAKSVKTIKSSNTVTTLPAYIPETDTVEKKKKQKKRKTTHNGEDMQVVETTEDEDKDEHQDENMHEENSATKSTEETDGCRWVMQRLRGLGSDPRGSKRFHVIKVFIALAAVESKSFLLLHLPQLMEVALRVRLYGGTAESQDGAVSQSEAAVLKESKAAATELLDILEQRVGSSALLGKYAEIQRRLQASKAEKKRVLASEAIKDPKAYAVRKFEKTQKKKESRKRKSLKHASVKGNKKRKGAAGCAILQEEE